MRSDELFDDLSRPIAGYREPKDTPKSFFAVYLLTFALSMIAIRQLN
ncbi:hypothetical protein HMPREF9294_0227 [Porphyromonas asaccharolytica PR426713P-I]|nr:hypothetical protein HMPREF9294_0227 [Porphyromonas asaccharolytica PR426713P-I]